MYSSDVPETVDFVVKHSEILLEVVESALGVFEGGGA